MAASGAVDLTRIYLHLTDGPDVAPVPVGPDFWQRLEERTDLADGRLVMAVRQSEDWPQWEMHPAGEEVVVQLSGAMALVLEEPGGERTVEVGAGEAVIVPRGIWHRGLVRAPGNALFITRGAGTQHRPR
jgi:mannose-6-phosphate isomerase-like protein (cupin superfamily)